jgi:hypothetical protein
MLILSGMIAFFDGVLLAHRLRLMMKTIRHDRVTSLAVSYKWVTEMTMNLRGRRDGAKPS